MNKFGFFVVLTLCSFFCEFSMQASVAQSQTRVKREEMTAGDIMKRCNQTYQITDAYLQQMNETGSFPDEFDKTPMCFVKCYLETLGVMHDDGKVDSDRAETAYELDSDEFIDECILEISSAGTIDSCEKAYSFARCIMTRSLLDNLSAESDHKY